jgi:hypothetical protein
MASFLKWSNYFFVLCLIASPIKAAAIYGTDADNHHIHINAPGRFTIVIYSSEDLQDRTRAVAKEFYPWYGRYHLKVIALVDLRDSLGGLVPGIVRDQMRSNLDEEAKRVEPYYRKNNNFKNPRKDLCAIPDFEGGLCEKLGWKDELEKVEVIFFDENGKEINRFTDPVNMGKASKILETHLKTIEQNSKLTLPERNF